ncbi:MAG: Gfo/Idh/MocA family oxidoreductase [Acetobacterales bacterium]
MNLHSRLLAREAEGRPLRVGLIGAGKFGSMFLSQARTTPGLHVAAIADLSPDRAAAALARTGWPAGQGGATGLSDALARRATWLTDDAAAMLSAGGIDVAIDATGDPHAGCAHAALAIDNGVHIVMVNVEADALAGPLLAKWAREAGVVYSLAYGDQPALICELVDWARSAGFEVAGAGKWTKYLPHYHGSTPDTVWENYGFSPEQVATGDYNPQMFNSFLDGTKSAIEMTAVANATGLTPAEGGLTFETCDAEGLAELLKPRGDGGMLEHMGQVEVISCFNWDGTPADGALRYGVWVTFAAASDYTARCFTEYGIAADMSGRYAALYRPYHMIGLELGVSVALAGLRGEATGSATGFRADVAAVAKRDLAAGEMLDGEGGYTVWGRLMPAAHSLADGVLPIGLAKGVRLRNAVPAMHAVRWQDVDIDDADPAVRLRREMETVFREAPA